MFGLSTVLEQVAHVAALIIGLLGCVVIVYGVARGAAALARLELAAWRSGDLVGRAELRRDLGFYLLLSLEFLVAADIIETIVSPTLEGLAVLGGIVLVRSAISFSLSWELRHEA